MPINKLPFFSVTGRGKDKGFFFKEISSFFTDRENLRVFDLCIL